MKKEIISSLVVPLFLVAPITYVIAMISTGVYQNYGWVMFLITPFAGGCISTLLYNRNGNKKLIRSIGVSLLAALVSLLGFFIVGTEGLICLLMAAPVVLPMFLLGGLVGYAVSKAIRNNKATSGIVSLLLIASIPLMLGFENRFLTPDAPRTVTTKVIIHGSANDVWAEVIAFSPIPTPTEIPFRMGIAYPTHAEIKGEGVGAIRFCHFSTGAFVEPITHWAVNRRLAFDVIEQPLPMTEMSPYVNLHPPHLDWAFRSHKGEFVINDIGNGQIELAGTT